MCVVHTCRRFSIVIAIVCGFNGYLAHAEDHLLHNFKRIRLSDVYYSEGANAGDVNKDGKPDIVCGPYWYEGPSFEQKHEIYEPKPQPTNFYADNFFSWIYDFNGDGWNDVFVVGFPGTPAHVYENPAGKEGRWTKHVVFDSVSNESPHFVNVTGDERPELVCTFGGMYGFATFNPEKPFEKWTFHAISDKSAPERFGHGLGVGDLDGDKRADILAANGWWQQPAQDPDTSLWEFHDTAFTNSYGGAEMLVYDVDGDGDNDVVTSLAAHDFGLAWYEQDRSGRTPVFRQHLIMDKTPEQNHYGLVFSELHSVALADMDGDGLKDIVTGKTYWSHHKSSPMWDAGAVVYWFKLVRTKEGVDWVPYLADGEAGIGRQVSVVDLNGDKLPDIVLGGMKGAHALIHSTKAASEAEWKKAQPESTGPLINNLVRGKPAPLDESGSAGTTVIEGESYNPVKSSAGVVVPQAMNIFPKDRWSGGRQLFWRGGKPGDRMELEFNLEKDATYAVQAVFTMASDYATVQVWLDGEKIGKPVDLFNAPDVITSGVLTIGERELQSGKHRLVIVIAGTNPAGVPSYMVGLDYLKFKAK